MIQKAVKFYVICAIKRFQAQNGTIPKLGIDVIVLSVQKTIEVGNEISRFFSIDIIPNVYGVMQYAMFYISQHNFIRIQIDNSTFCARMI